MNAMTCDYLCTKCNTEFSAVHKSLTELVICPCCAGTIKHAHANDVWLKQQCNRYSNGMCSTRACLVRGGYSGTGPVNYAKATCEPHEILCELHALRLARERHIEQQKQQ